MELIPLLKRMIDEKASDIFVIAGQSLTFESSGRFMRLSGDALMPADTKEIVKGIYGLADRDFRIMEENVNHDEDFSFAIGGVGRFRANVFRQRGSMSAIIRVIPFGLPNPVDYEIPEDVLCLSRLTKGFVLVTGPAGSGKTTTLTCIIDRLNHERTGHIITMEDPIEYVHHHESCIVTQREIPTDVATYAEALRSALRQAPDVIFLGEMRDTETISTAMTAAEMAQLLFSTLHTTSASGTIDRIIDTFPAVQQHQIRIQLSLVLQAIVCQQLVPTVDGKVTPVFEIMRSNPAIRNLIRERKTHQIDSVIAAGGKEGMRTMDQSLFRLVKEGRITSETALRYSIHEEALERHLEIEKLL
jgi:twitching motility protein PilT